MELDLELDLDLSLDGQLCLDGDCDYEKAGSSGSDTNSDTSNTSTQPGDDGVIEKEDVDAQFQDGLEYEEEGRRMNGLEDSAKCADQAPHIKSDNNKQDENEQIRVDVHSELQFEDPALYPFEAEE